MPRAEAELAAIESRIGALLDAGRLADAAHDTIESFGPELHGLFMAMRRDESDARELFSQLCEDLWRGLSAFERRSTVRTWCYALARHALSRFGRDAFRRRGRRLATTELQELADRISSQESRERKHAKLDAARAALDADDQLLLILRIDRSLPWNDVARVLADSDDAAADAAVVRKRFERIKQRLRVLLAE